MLMLNWFELETAGGNPSTIIDDVDEQIAAKTAMLSKISEAALIAGGITRNPQQNNLFSFGGAGFINDKNLNGFSYSVTDEWMKNPTQTTAVWGRGESDNPFIMDGIDTGNYKMCEEVTQLEWGTWWPMQVAWGNEHDFDYSNVRHEMWRDRLEAGNEHSPKGSLFRIVGHIDGIPVAQPYAPAMMSMGLMFSNGISFLSNDGWADSRIRRTAWAESNKTFADEECQAFESVKWMRGVLASSSVLVMLRGCSEGDYPLGCICVIEIAKYILGDDGIYDLLRVANYPVNDEGRSISTSTSTLRIIPKLGSMGHHLKDFDNQVDLLSYAIGRERFLSVMGNGSKSVTESAEGFIPTWRDRRMPIQINKAIGARYSFHDLIRCSECNGRVILMLQTGHGYSAVECPHCKTADGIKCSHLKIKEIEKT